MFSRILNLQNLHFIPWNLSFALICSSFKNQNRLNANITYFYRKIHRKQIKTNDNFVIFFSKIRSCRIRINMWWPRTFVWLTSAYSDTRPCSLLTKILAALVFFALCSSMTAIGSFSLGINEKHEDISSMYLIVIIHHQMWYFSSNLCLKKLKSMPYWTTNNKWGKDGICFKNCPVLLREKIFRC